MPINNEKIWLKNKGVSLVELIVFLVVIAIAWVSLARIYPYLVNRWQQPLINKQLAQMASYQLNFILAQRYDENSPNNGEVCGLSNVCAGMGVDAGEALSDLATLDDIDDFNGYIDSPLPGFTRRVSVAYIGAELGIDDQQAKQIHVSVAGPNGAQLALFAYRVNAP